ncbi:MAG: permease prefix domain 1-containing protein [Mycobacteriales bacterium]
MTVDDYLDRVFTLLAGSGAAGRRAYLEIEAHLREAVEEERAAGLDPAAAEARAIARFGDAGQVTRGMLTASAEGTRAVVARMVGAGWLLGWVGLLSIGVSGPLAAAVGAIWGKDYVSPDQPGATYSRERCRDLFEYFPHASSCRAASVEHHYWEVVQGRIALGVLGLLALGAWLLTRRSQRWRWLTVLPPAGMVAAAGATLFGVTAVLLTGQGLATLGSPLWTGAGTTIVSGLAAAPACVAFLIWLLRELRIRAG